jgi:hypothetical protein
MAAPSREGQVPLLDKVFQFLVDHFSKQPPWLRAFVYFVFVMFFLTTSARLIGGRYAVKGIVWDGDQYAQNCEIRLNGEWFSTNTRGEYHALFTSRQYYSLLVTRTIDLPVVRGGKNQGAYRVTLGVFDDQFGDIFLGSKRAARSSPPHPFSFDLVSSVYAQSPFNSSVDRLYLQRLTLSADARKVREAAFQLGVKGQLNPKLMSLGVDAGELPVKSAGSVAFPVNAYYFQFPRTLRGRTVTVELHAGTGFLQSFHETFRLTLPAQSKEIQARGDKGGLIVTKFVPGA